ncbi:MAG: type III-B CRISPR module RAMP protein Cmr1 [Deltaproteobacteria bacterium]|nr:type III-B CRISPR module RAMP protein Cmr1 [Deltaproteobacteria bacterium]
MPINIARFIDRETAEFTVEVLTPMFLGGANGDAELRAAPLKNAVRYWWRITQGELSHEKMLEKEQKLFGGVTDKATRSLVDVVVTGSVRTGNVEEEDFIGKKFNPEAGHSVSLASYLGMGPIHFKGKYMKKRILPAETFSLTVSYPKENKENIIDALSLFAEFGSLGARSRNGWGSFNLLVMNDSISLSPRKKLLEKYGEEVSKIFKVGKKYPFKLGISNEQPLLWEIGMGNTWEDAMRLAGESYMDLRQQVLPFPQAPPNGVQRRHILGYPVTKHKVKTWEENRKNGRMPSQLRIIIRKTGNNYNAYFFHLPHKIPKPWDSSLGSELSVWQKIHNYLDENFERTT